MWLQDAVDAVEPDPRLPFNWVRAYREGLYAESEEAHKKAERVGEPREPEMRLVLEGELTEAPAGATVRPPVQHSTEQQKRTSAASSNDTEVTLNRPMTSLRPFEAGSFGVTV